MGHDDNKSSRQYTDPNQDDSKLLACEERYATLFETMKHGVVYQNADGTIISANPAAERILGLSMDQMMGRTSVDPRWKAVREDKTEFRGEEHPSMVALRTGEIVENVIMGVFNPGSNDYRWINVTAVPLFNTGESKPYQVYTTFEDISDRIQIERSLREKEFAINSSINAIAFADDKGMITYVNEALLRMWGYNSPSEVIGRSVVEFWKEKEKMSRQLQFILSGRGGHGEFIAERKDGSSFVVFVSAGPIKSGNGTNSSFMASCIDITETKKMEKETENQKKELELYASILKHDIGNDLQILLSYIESLEPMIQRDQEIHQKRLTPLRASISRMTKLLNSLGQSEEAEQATLPHMLENIAKDSEDIHEGLKINIQIEDDVHELSTIGFRFLHTVFENLIRNAAQHAGNHPTVNIDVERANGDVIINLVDDGKGIPESLKSNLFQKGTSTNGGGLGLYLARQILSIYNGTIELLDSEEDEGAKFRIVIPLQPSF